MPKIVMKITTPGSSDGITVNNYVAGRKYPVGDALAKAFISMGVAEYAKEEKFVRIAPENKMVESSLDNKVAESSDEDSVVGGDSVVDNSGGIIEEAEKLDNTSKALRVYQLADELGVSSKKILRIAKKLGIFVSAPASGLSEEEEKRIKSAS